MKNFLSFLFSLLVIGAICTAAYFNKPFVMKQVNKVQGMYFVYKGDKAYKKLKMKSAISYYNKGLKLYPGHYGAWYNLGNIYAVYEDYPSSMYAYSQAFKHNPKMMTARMNYGIISSERLGDFDSAITQYDKVIKTKRRIISIPYVYDNKLSTKENHAIAYYNKGVAYRLKSLYSNDDWEQQRIYLAKAIEAYKKSLEISPKNYDTLYNLGLAYHISGNYNEAAKNYCKAMSVSPLKFEAHYNMAILLRKLGHYKEAYEEIDKASTIISALNENSSLQQYAAIMMNDITRSVYNNEYRKQLGNILKDEEDKINEHMVKDKKDLKTKENKKNGTLKEAGVSMVHGKIVESEDLDKVLFKSYGKCAGLTYFEDEKDDD